MIHKWVKLALENRVNELVLNLDNDGNTICTLPATIYSAESLTMLDLCGCKLEKPPPSIGVFIS